MPEVSKTHDEFDFIKYYPRPNENKINNVFDFFISNDESVIYKKNNESSAIFSGLLKSPHNF